MMILRRMREAARHILNPMHVYCRLVERGINREKALSFCRKYEVLIYKRVLGPK